MRKTKNIVYPVIYLLIFVFFPLVILHKPILFYDISFYLIYFIFILPLTFIIYLILFNFLSNKKNKFKKNILIQILFFIIIYVIILIYLYYLIAKAFQNSSFPF